MGTVATATGYRFDDAQRIAVGPARLFAQVPHERWVGRQNVTTE